MGKIIFLDIDGTIRDFDGYIPDTTIDAIKIARRNGHKVCISTGRTYGQIEERVKEIGFDGIVSGSGSYVEYEGKRVRYEYFEPIKYTQLCEYLRKNKCIFQMQSFQGLYIIKEQLDEFSNIMNRIQKSLGLEAREISMLPTVIECTMEVEKIEKILFFSDELSNEKLLKDWGQDLYVVPHSIPNASKWGGEITPIHVNKAEGIRSILQQSEYIEADVIAIGDSENDIEMLKMASVGIAMGNGAQKIKNAADLITDSVREDGIKKAFQKLDLI